MRTPTTIFVPGALVEALQDRGVENSARTAAQQCLAAVLRGGSEVTIHDTLITIFPPGYVAVSEADPPETPIALRDWMRAIDDSPYDADERDAPVSITFVLPIPTSYLLPVAESLLVAA